MLELGANLELSRPYLKLDYVNQYDIIEMNKDIIRFLEINYSQLQFASNQQNNNCPKFKFINGDYQNIEINKEGSQNNNSIRLNTKYDNVIALHSLSYVNKPYDTLKGMYNATRKGGYIYIVENGLSDLVGFKYVINAFR